MRFIRRVCSPALLLMLALTCAHGETYEEKLKDTDQTNPDQVLALSQWCQENNLPTKARQLLFLVIKLDKDHAEARALLGQVKVGDRWVAKNQLKEDPKSGKAGGAEKPEPSGPAPSAKDVTWNLTLPPDAHPGNKFVDAYIARMQSSANDSGEMEVAVSTVCTADNLPTALPRICAALMKPEFTDLYGPSGVVQELLRTGRRADAKLLFPFVANASTRCTDADDLMAFAFAAAQIRDKRAVPRLIELMSNDNKDLAQSAGDAVAAITAIPRDTVTIGKASSWWSRFHRTDDTEILRAQLRSSEPETALAAANELGALQEKKVLDVLIELLKGDDVKITSKAHQLVTTFTGRDWAYVPTDPKEQRLKRVELLAKWWKENRETFVFTIDPRLVKESAIVPEKTNAAAADPSVAGVRDLGSTDAKAAAKAESDLLGRGGKAVSALIDGVASGDPIISRKSHELLQRISKKSDIAFNPRDTPEQKQKAIDAWKTWATANKFLHEEADGEKDDKDDK